MRGTEHLQDCLWEKDTDFCYWPKVEEAAVNNRIYLWYLNRARFLACVETFEDSVPSLTLNFPLDFHSVYLQLFIHMFLFFVLFGFPIIFTSGLSWHFDKTYCFASSGCHVWLYILLSDGHRLPFHRAAPVLQSKQNAGTCVPPESGRESSF